MSNPLRDWADRKTGKVKENNYIVHIIGNNPNSHLTINRCNSFHIDQKVSTFKIVFDDGTTNITMKNITIMPNYEYWRLKKAAGEQK